MVVFLKRIFSGWGSGLVCICAVDHLFLWVKVWTRRDGKKKRNKRKEKVFKPSDVFIGTGIYYRNFIKI